MWRIKLLAISLTTLSLCVVSCQRALRSGTLIDHYRGAGCVQPNIAKGVTPPTRGWDATITVPGGLTIRIMAANMVSGNVGIRYLPDGPELTAVRPGDYIYPSDVRVDEARGVLYVKARGLAAGIWQETWLYEYDLQRRRELARALVDPSVLPPECPM